MSQLTARVPVGFRFHPTDEELVGYYLPKKVNARKIDLDLIRELDLYKLEPWDLQELCKIQADCNEKQSDCYFFSRKDKKYPTGNRANRATAKGFWKATGRDKPISSKLRMTHQLIGMRKTLVFYQGRAPHGVKTDWIMHEFRLDDGPGRPAHEDGGWVVCRVFKKNKNLKPKLQERAVSYEEEQMGLLPEPLGSPEILSGRFSVPEQPLPLQYVPGGAIKLEIINLDVDDHYHQQSPYNNSLNNNPNLGMSVKAEENNNNNNNSSHSMLSSNSSSYLVRAMSFRRPEDYLNIPGSPGDFNDQATTSGSDGGEGDDCSILGNLENIVDWSAFIVQPDHQQTANNNNNNSGKVEFLRCPSSGKMNMSIGNSCTITDPSSVLVTHQNIKRQNSDIFSSLDLWNYSQVAQHM